MDSYINEAYKKATAGTSTFSLMMLDIDDFKRIKTCITASTTAKTALYAKRNKRIHKKQADISPILKRYIRFFSFYFTGVIFWSFSTTSCAPPSMILTEETSVSFAFSCNSGMLSAPQLHIVCFIFARVTARLS